MPVLEADASVTGPRGSESVDLIATDPRYVRLAGPLLQHFKASLLAHLRAIALPGPIAEAVGTGPLEVVKLQVGAKVVQTLVGAELDARSIGVLVNSPIALAPLAYAQKLTQMHGRVTRIFVQIAAWTRSRGACGATAVGCGTHQRRARRLRGDALQPGSRTGESVHEDVRRDLRAGGLHVRVLLDAADDRYASRAHTGTATWRRDALGDGQDAPVRCARARHRRLAIGLGAWRSTVDRRVQLAARISLVCVPDRIAAHHHLAERSCRRWRRDPRGMRRRAYSDAGHVDQYRAHRRTIPRTLDRQLASGGNARRWVCLPRSHDDHPACCTAVGDRRHRGADCGATAPVAAIAQCDRCRFRPPAAPTWKRCHGTGARRVALYADPQPVDRHCRDGCDSGVWQRHDPGVPQQPAAWAQPLVSRLEHSCGHMGGSIWRTESVYDRPLPEYGDRKARAAFRRARGQSVSWRLPRIRWSSHLGAGTAIDSVIADSPGPDSLRATSRWQTRDCARVAGLSSPRRSPPSIICTSVRPSYCLRLAIPSSESPH